MINRFIHIVLAVFSVLVLLNFCTILGFEIVTIQELFYSVSLFLVLGLALGFSLVKGFTKWLSAGFLILQSIMVVSSFTQNTDYSNPLHKTYQVLSLNVAQFQNDTTVVNETLELLKNYDADFVCLQEFGLYYKWPNTESVLLDFLDRSDYEFGYFKPKKDNIFGIAFLSKFPIVNQSLLYASDEGTNQGLTYTILVDGDTIRITNLQLESFNFSKGFSLNRMTETITTQRAQLGEVLNNNQSAKSDIIIGDFNNLRGGITMQLLSKNGFQLENHSFLNSMLPSFKEIPLRIDHCAHALNVEILDTKIGYSSPSDHAALIVDFRH